MRSRILIALLGTAALPTSLLADTGEQAGDTGISGVWILANFCYAGMRAQARPSVGWRILSFIFGFPGTLVSMLLIEEGSERVYGVDLPRVDRVGQPKSVPPDHAP